MNMTEQCDTYVNDVNVPLVCENAITDLNEDPKDVHIVNVCESACILPKTPEIFCGLGNHDDGFFGFFGFLLIHSENNSPRLY